MKRILLICLFALLSFSGFSQALSSYSFSAFNCPYVSVSAPFITYSGGSTWGAGGAYDDCWYSGIPIGFNFNYCGTTYTFLGASANCWAVLGQTFPTSGTPNTYDNDLPNTAVAANLPRPILAPWWVDAVTSGANVRYATTGTAPYRVFTIEWYNVSFFSYSGLQPPALNVEIKLYETSNNIDFTYEFLYYEVSNTGYQAVGITGGSAPYPATGTMSFWSLNNATSSPTPSMSTATRSISGMPASGQVYRWSYQCAGTPTPGTVGATTTTGCATYTTDLSLNCSSQGAGITYQWQTSPDNSTWTDVTGATNAVYTATISAHIYYRCVLTCSSSGSSAATPGVEFFSNIPPSPISGPTNLCIGYTATFTNSTTGGTWLSSNTGVATIGSTTGIATGVAAGTTVITYKLVSTGCYSTTTLTVNTSPTSITGPSTVCTGGTSTLGNGVPGGAWTSSNTGVATVGTSSGIVTGVTVGTTVITYSLGGACMVTTTITCNPSPSAITGTTFVCEGSTTTLSDPTPGGTWSSSRLPVATVGSATGIVTGVSAGTSVITYALTSTGCRATTVVTVSPLPAIITGLSSVCVAATISLTDGTPGGLWSSSNTGVATVGSTTGVVTGVSAGLVTITYRLPTGCYVTTDITVLPIPAPITGIRAICETYTTTLSDATTGGAWSSSDVTIADIDGTGLVTGYLAGTAIITYGLSTGCFVTTTMTINRTPDPITGVTAICLGLTSTLTDAGGGTWMSNNTAVAPIGSLSGIVTGLTLGTAIITYTLPTGCYQTVPVIVNPLPTPISGSSVICVGSTTTFTSPGGGTWSSSNGAVAPVITLLGLVTGLSPGTATITYTLSTGCIATKTITVTSSPSAISGTASLCVGGTTTLSNTLPGGRWSSSSTGIATVGTGTGIVTGVAVGTATITYSVGTGCYATRMVTVSPNPAAITGTRIMCEGASVTLADATAGGRWSSSNTGVATVGTGTGVVTGVAAGTAVISYTIGLGCSAIATVTVNPSPGTIGGPSVVCSGQSVTLTNSVGGGLWTSSNTAVATIGSSTGVVNGVLAGTSVITYNLGAGCLATVTITVSPVPGTITGSLNVCLGLTTPLSNTVGGGLWTSTNTGVATIGSTSGIVTGVSAGTSIISYTLPSGCFVTATVTVNPAPLAIAGPSTVCSGATITLTDPITGGSWTSSNTAVATVGSLSGIVTGVAAGTSVITYSLGLGCVVTKTITVNTSPTAISGPSALCVGATVALTNGVPGGTWISDNTAVATIGSTSGSVFGVALGTATITYTVSGGCFVTTTLTVSPTPGPILGSATVCLGGSTAYSNIVLGGLWTTSSTSISLGSISGIATGVSLGTAIITYSLGTGCTAYRTVTVIPGPAAIVGAAGVCTGATTTYTDATTGGTWTSSTTTIATVGSGTGVVSGVASGTATITYTAPTGCFVTKTITVYPTPVAISGGTSMCIGATTSLTDATPGGVWSSSNTAVATVGSLTGTVLGVTSGTSVISYTLGAGCVATITVTVLPTPGPITGVPVTGVGSTTTLGNIVTGGVWSSSNTAIGTVDASTGVVGGISLGTAIVTYTIGACFTTQTITVTSAPTPIGGPRSLCTGTTALLTNGVGGGTWTSTNTAVATIGSLSGVVNGIAAGTTTITYSLGFGLVATTTLTVTTSPLPIAGTSGICVGATTLLTDPTPGGGWSSGTTGVATISGVGMVTGVSAGTSSITYALGSCYALKVVTVFPTPSAISGPTGVCAGNTISLTNLVGGGTWVSSSTVRATVGLTTGVVTGVLAGTATITYSLGGSCIALHTVTVYPNAPITGPSNVCVGSSVTLANSVSGGLWSSDNTLVATIGSTSGIVFGVDAGTAVISYLLPSGCSSSTTITVNPLPAAISGVASVCVGATITLTDATPGGTWSTTGTLVTVGSGTGVVTGVNPGVAGITYTLATGCRVNTNVTVNPLPAAIVGSVSGCVGATILFTDATPGGLWSSSNTSVADIGSTTGIVTGIASGPATITYQLSTGCFVTRSVTIYPVPLAIVGTAQVCVGQTTILADGTPGGTWVSSLPGIAAVGSSSGVVSGLVAGTSVISYVLSTGCFATTTMVVVPVPTAIIGRSDVCVGSTITLSDAIPGGVWSSANTGVATIGSTTGILTGISSGTVLVDYTLGSGCMAMTTIIVNPVSPINGPNTVCQGQAITLSDTTEGGVWSSSGPGIATVVRTGDTTAIVRGLTTGVATITYFLPTGCVAYKIVRVLPAPPAITGSSQVCQGSTITLGDPVFGGTWTSGSTGIATVGLTTGVVYGVAPGVATISYTVGSCPATRDITVNPLPAPIAGSFNVCVGSTNILTDATTGGTWLSSRPATATIGVGTGALTGVATGTATISYVLITTGCAATQVVNVDPVPLPITGSSNVCIGLTSALADATPFGGWSSSAPGTAYVDAFGLVTGISLGTATITYTIGTGCFVTRLVTVNSLPPAITGATNVCQGQSVTFSDAAPGGSWLSGDVTIATAGSSTGIVTGVAPGTAPITYTLGTGCIAVKDIIVDPLPSPIVGTPQVCEGQTTMLYSGPPGGGWSSSATPVATVDAGSGLVTGVRAGTATITYSNGCYTTITVTVNIMPAVITGNTNICLGSTSALRNTVSGGSWSSSAPAIAPVGLSGIVTGAALGTATITYAMGAGCLVTTSVKVLPLPNVYTVGGGGSFCASGAGVHITLSGSEVGVNYLLYIGSTPTGTFAGTGSALDFGLQTVGGLYRVVAISSISGCSSNMAGTATVVVNPTLIPSVNITAGPSDTICAGASTTFTAAPTNGGTAPTYVWTVNGVTVGAGSTYTFIPADGDVIRTILTSNALCALPDTASYSKRITVSANQTPVVNIVSAPGDTVCKGMAITLTANAVYGGSSPAIVWRKFGLNVSAGPTYAYIPNDGDVVTCFITSNYPCLLTDTATSLGLQISVDTPLLPHVLITASPSTHVGTGKTVTLTANVEDAGLHPTYQWLKNGVPIPGGTNSIYSSNTFATGYQDSVTCMVTSSGVCPVSSFGWVYILVSDVSVGGVGATGGNLQILPNPNNGTFTLKGTTGDNTTEELQLDITNMLGQTVHRQTLQAKAGKVNEQISITGQLANGMYLLSLHSASGVKVFHMVVER